MASRNTNLGWDGTDIIKSLSDKFLLFSKTNNKNTDSNVAQTAAEARTNGVFAKALNYNDFMRVIEVPSGVRALWNSGGNDPRSGTISGMYKWDGGSFPYNNTSTNWDTWVNSEGYIFKVLSNVLNMDISNDPIRFQSALTNISGKAFDIDGGRCVCVGKTRDDDMYNSYKRYISVFPVQDAYDSLQNSYTSMENKAISICGVGNERRYGTCCLYYSTKKYDKIRGVTYDAGDFYRCTCTECYRCYEIAEQMGMQYRFNKWVSADSGVTGGTGENCLHCDSEDFPSNCGPCECRIDWKERTYHYDSILSDSNISPHTDIYENARIAKANEAEGGSVTFVGMNFRKFTNNELVIPETYRYDRKLLPIIADNNAGEIPVIELVTENWENKVILIGFKIVEPGAGASVLNVDFDELINTYLPSADKQKLQEHTTVHLAPLEGFHKAFDQLYSLRVMMNIQINKSVIAEKTDSVEFDTISICDGGDASGGSMFTGKAPNQSSVIRTSNKLTIKNTEAESAPPSGGSSKGSSPDPSSMSADDVAVSASTTLGGSSVLYSSALAADGTADIEISGRKELYGVGKTLTINNVIWETESVDVDTTLAGDTMDVRTIKVLHSQKLKTPETLGNDPGNNNKTTTINYQVFL